MELEEFKEKIEHYSKKELNVLGNLLTYIEDQVKDTYEYYRSYVLLNFVFKNDYKNEFESCLHVCYDLLGIVHYNIESDLEQISKIREVPESKLEKYSRGKFTHSEIIELFNKMTGLKSNYLQLDFLNQTCWSRFCLITYHVLHHQNFKEYVNKNIPEVVLETLLGKKEENDEYNYLKVINLAKEQVKDAIYISELK